MSEEYDPKRMACQDNIEKINQLRKKNYY